MPSGTFVIHSSGDNVMSLSHLVQDKCVQDNLVGQRRVSKLKRGKGKKGDKYR